MKIQEFWGVTPCQTVNSYRHKVYRSASIFRAKKLQKTVSHYLTLKTEAPHACETHAFTSLQDTWIFKSFHINNYAINSILSSWIVCVTSKALVYENIWFEQNRIILIDEIPCCLKYRVIKKDGLNWTANGAPTHARQLVAVFQVLCSLYGFTCVGYAQNSPEFVSHSPLIHVVGRSFCLYTDSLFAQNGDSNDKCSSSLEVECWNEDEMHAAQQSPSQF